MTVIHSSDNKFDEDVVRHSTPVIVDFFADWCGPCRMIAPAFEALASEYAGKVKFVKVDIDVNPDTPVRFGVRSIPTLLLFKDGQVVKTQVGSMSQSALDEWIKSSI
jgi:thioredoxin 1